MSHRLDIYYCISQNVSQIVNMIRRFFSESERHYIFISNHCFTAISLINKTVGFLKMCKFLCYCCKKYEETIKSETLISHPVFVTYLRLFISCGYRLISLNCLLTALSSYPYCVYCIPSCTTVTWDICLQAEHFLHFGILPQNTESWYGKCSIMI